MIVFAESSSAMRVESMNKVQDWIDENATKNEKTYIAGMVPQIFESTRTVTASIDLLNAIRIGQVMQCNSTQSRSKIS